MTLPTFLVIGAMKAGTTSLHRYLEAHPDVHMCRTKELRFFVEDGEWHRGVDWYREQFAGGECSTAVGETSTDYSKHPLHPGVAARAVSVLPDVRIVYLLRHPIERIRSYHRHALGETLELPIAEALRRSRGEYVVPSRYGLQLREWSEHVPRDRIHVLTSEDLADDPAGTMASLFAFLGVEPRKAPAQPYERHNRAGQHRRIFAPAASVRRSAWYRGVRHRLPGPVRRLVWRTASRTRSVDLELAELPPEVERQLLDDLLPDLHLLRQLLPDFPCWGLLDDGASQS